MTTEPCRASATPRPPTASSTDSGSAHRVRQPAQPPRQPPAPRRPAASAAAQPRSAGGGPDHRRPRALTSPGAVAARRAGASYWWSHAHRGSAVRRARRCRWPCSGCGRWPRPAGHRPYRCPGDAGRGAAAVGRRDHAGRRRAVALAAPPDTALMVVIVCVHRGAIGTVAAGSWQTARFALRQKRQPRPVAPVAAGAARWLATERPRRSC